MPIEYIIPITSGNEKDNTLERILISKITKLKKLQETRMQVIETVGIQQWSRALWNQQKNPNKQFDFGDYILWFPSGNKSHLTKFIRKWFGLYKVQYVFRNNTVLLVTIEDFETNLVLVSANKLKPYKYMEFEV
jgi:hypothetical protein